jgi:AcrR family transcriptional regulator
VPRHRQGEDLRGRILDACERQLADGPAAVTVREVAETAGVSNGTLYHYFPSVDELLFAVATRAASVQQQAFGSPAEGFTAVIARLFDPARRDTILPWLRLRARTSPELAAAIKHYDRSVNAQYTEAIRAAADDLGLRDHVDIESAVEIVRALAEGVQLRVASDTLAVDSGQLVAAIVDVLTNAWFASPSRP